MSRLYQTAGGFHREGDTGMSGFAKIVVRYAEEARTGKHVGYARMSYLRFHAARIIDGTYCAPYNGIL